VLTPLQITMSLSPTGRPYSEPVKVARQATVAHVLGKEWRSPVADPDLVAWVTGQTVRVAPAAKKRAVVDPSSVRVFGEETMVARVDGFVMVVSTDHVLVNVNSVVTLVAANRLVMIPLAGPGKVKVAVRDNNGCRVPLMPAGGVAAYMDQHGATNAVFRVAPNTRHRAWNVGSGSGPGGLDNAAVCQVLLRGGDEWMGPGCLYTCTHAASIWKHIDQKGHDHAPDQVWQCYTCHFQAPRIEEVWAHQQQTCKCNHESQVLSARAVAHGWRVLFDDPPNFGSPMTTHGEGTLGEVCRKGLQTPSASKLYTRLWGRLQNLSMASSCRRFGGGNAQATELRTAEQFYKDIGAIVL
jgi:hypothetical protein